MDASFIPKRPFDPSNFRTPPPPPFKLGTGESLLRILCPAAKTGGVIGKGGVIIRQVREETGARIRIDDSVPGCDERVILIAADSTKKDSSSAVEAKQNIDNVDANGEESPISSSNLNIEGEGTPAQQALVRVFERIVKVDEERSGTSTERENGGENEAGGYDGGGATPQGPVVCRLLAPSNQVGCVLGRGGKIVEKIRLDSGAQVRVLPKDKNPPCAFPGDELIQIAGKFSAVRKALLSVSSCLQDKPMADAVNSPAPRSSGKAFYGTGVDNIGANHRIVMEEEEVLFKLLCQVDKVGSLIGKGGSIIRSLQSDTGASIKIADAAPGSDEKIVVISARENSEQRHSPAQDAVIRVLCRISEIGFELGAAVVARLLVPSQQIGCLLGKGGMIIEELRRATGASICVFPKEQVPKYSSQNDEVLQVIGSMQSVQDALFQVTSRLRETIFTVSKPHLPGASASHYLPPFREMPSPLFRPRHDPTSPGHYASPVGHPRGVPSQPLDPQHFSHGMDHVSPTYFDRAAYPYGSDRPFHGPSFDRQSPRGWASQAVASGNPRGVAEVGGGIGSSNGPTGSGSQTVEVVIPQALLCHVYGENNSNLMQIRQISGANITVHDPRPGATEGVVVVCGTPDQMHAAQSLIHAFILAELPF